MIREAGVVRVVVGVGDPAPHVSGKGIRRLRAAGVRVDTGVLADACAAVHEHYLHHVRTGLPFVSMKAAVSLDGRIAAASGDSRWITGERARRHAHRLRAEHHAIAIGASTALVDDPRLDVRHVRGVDPIRIVFDSHLEVAKGRARPRILREGTLVVHASRAPASARRRLAATGAEGVSVRANAAGHVSIAAALRALGKRQLRSLLVEGGGRLHAAFVAARAWNRLFVYQSPMLLGEGKPMIAGLAWDKVARAPRLRVEQRKRLGDDMLTVLVPRG
jgi:diaminohydroxyphosphoribosylaminopyrimidine deaminase/5-amino-6-(5-phosphoribosylamino)uracil reductase